jgi:hypothetical protein
VSLYLKSEKIPALLYLGKGPKYMPFSLLALGTDLKSPKALLLYKTTPKTFH